MANTTLTPAKLVQQVAYAELLNMKIMEDLIKEFTLKVIITFPAGIKSITVGTEYFFQPQKENVQLDLIKLCSGWRRWAIYNDIPRDQPLW